MAALTAAAALIVFILAFAALAWLITMSPWLLAVVVVGAGLFVGWVARHNDRDEW